MFYCGIFCAVVKCTHLRVAFTVKKCILFLSQHTGRSVRTARPKIHIIKTVPSAFLLLFPKVDYDMLPPLNLTLLVDLRGWLTAYFKSIDLCLCQIRSNYASRISITFSFNATTSNLMDSERTSSMRRCCHI